MRPAKLHKMMRIYAQLWIALQLAAWLHQCAALQGAAAVAPSTGALASARPRTVAAPAIASATKPSLRHYMPRRASLAAALVLAATPRAARALGVRDGLLDRCPETASCISSQDDAARGGRSFRPPWAYDDAEWTSARDKLLVALRTGTDSEALVDGRYIRCGDLSGASVNLKSRRRR
jgi:hypothetical protein